MPEEPHEPGCVTVLDVGADGAPRRTEARHP